MKKLVKNINSEYNKAILFDFSKNIIWLYLRKEHSSVLYIHIYIYTVLYTYICVNIYI